MPAMRFGLQSPTGKTHAEQTLSVFLYCIHFALGFSSELKNVENAAKGTCGFICCHAEGLGGFEIECLEEFGS